MNCKICNHKLEHFSNAFFDRSSIDKTEVGYFKCGNCELICAPEFDDWSSSDWETKVYTVDYNINVDDGCVNRQHRTANKIKDVRFNFHLDFGCGNGLLSQILMLKYGKQSYFYDPFNRHEGDFDLPKCSANAVFDLVTAVEVFEHLVDPNLIFDQINPVTSKGTRLMTNTKLSSTFNGAFRDFWYVNPRAGHISFYTKKTLEVLANKHGWQLTHSNGGSHDFIKL